MAFSYTRYCVKYEFKSKQTQAGCGRNMPRIPVLWQAWAKGSQV